MTSIPKYPAILLPSAAHRIASCALIAVVPTACFASIDAIDGSTGSATTATSAGSGSTDGTGSTPTTDATGPTTDPDDTGTASDSGSDTGSDSNSSTSGEPEPLPFDAAAFSVSPSGVDVNGADANDATLVVVGNRATGDSNMRDGFFATFDAGGERLSFVGGDLNDQLFDVAVDGNSAMAVGLTRSFLGDVGSDQAMLVHGDLSTGTLTVTRHFTASDQAVQLRAVVPALGGWAAAGVHDGDGGYVVTTQPDGTPIEAVSFSVVLGGSEYRPKSIVAGAGVLFVIGDYDDSGVHRGLVLAFQTSPLSLIQAQSIDTTAPLSLFDAVVADDELVVVGAAGTSGVLASLRTDDLSLISGAVFEGVELRGVAVVEDEVVLAGVTGDAAISGVVDGATVRAAALDGAGFSSFLRVPLAVAGDSVTLVGRVGTNIARIPLNAAGQASCDGALLGTPQVFEIEDTLTTQAIVLESVTGLTLSSDTPAATVTPATIDATGQCL